MVADFPVRHAAPSAVGASLVGLAGSVPHEVGRNRQVVRRCDVVRERALAGKQLHLRERHQSAQRQPVAPE